MLKEIINKYQDHVDSIHIISVKNEENVYTYSPVDEMNIHNNYHTLTITITGNNTQTIFTCSPDKLDQAMKQNIALLKHQSPIFYVHNNSQAQAVMRYHNQIPNIQTSFTSLCQKLQSQFEIIENIEIANSDSTYSVVNSFGLDLQYEVKSTYVYAEVIAMKDNDKQAVYKYCIGRAYQEEAFVNELISLGRDKLNPKVLKTGIYNCVFTPNVARYFLETFFEFISGFSIVNKQSNPIRNSQLFSDAVTIQEHNLNYCLYDYEGFPVQNYKPLVNQGILENFALNRKHAKLCNLEPTGNGFETESYLSLLVNCTDYVAKNYITVREILSPDINLLTGQGSIMISGVDQDGQSFFNSILSFDFFYLMKNLIPLSDLNRDSDVHTPSFFVPELNVAGEQ